MVSKTRLFFRTVLADAQRDLPNFKPSNWKPKLLAKVFLCVLICYLTLSLAVLPIILPLLRFDDRIQTACSPIGDFLLYPELYSYWGREGIFQVNIAFGEYSFAQAKLIDVAWDVGFGRIGQMGIALCSWRVFRFYMTASMAKSPVTYDSFRTVFIGGNPSFWSTVRLTRDLVFRKGLTSKIATAFMVATMSLTLAFPTLAGAMTGYTSILKAYVPDHQNGNRIRFDKFSPVLYTIHDGERVNETADYHVVDTPGAEGPSLDPVLSPLSSQDYICRRSTRSPLGEDAYYVAWDLIESNVTGRHSENCYLPCNVSEYARNYGFDGTANLTTMFMGHRLEPPALNISLSYFFDLGQDPLYGAKRSSKLLGKDKVLWIWANDTYDYQYVAANGTCQSNGKYKWGFSFVQAFSMAVMLCIWSFGILLMWYRAQSLMAEQGREHVSGTHKAILELAMAMQEEVTFGNGDVQLLREDNIRNRIASVRGGAISYPKAFDDEEELPDTSFRRWIRREKWWLLVVFFLIVVVSAGSITSFSQLAVMVGGLACGLAFALCFGSTWKSRILFCSCFTICWVIGASVGLFA